MDNWLSCCAGNSGFVTLMDFICLDSTHLNRSSFLSEYDGDSFPAFAMHVRDGMKP